jgi:XTP/dITP diphosphohydrolase
MKTVIIATKNQGKAKEFEKMVGRDGGKVKSLLDFPDAPDVEETGSTFTENAILKAETIAKHYHTKVIADDSGLVVDALDGRPGVYYARYAGTDKDDEANIDKVLKELEDTPFEKRTARFKCVLAVAEPERSTETYEGTCEGHIAFERKGNGGFGYDPIFYVPEKEKTLAELTDDEKNQISHRARALHQLEQRSEEHQG